MEETDRWTLDLLDRRGVPRSVGTSDCDDHRLLSTLSTEAPGHDLFVGDQNDSSAANETPLLQTISQPHRSVRSSLLHLKTTVFLRTVTQALIRCCSHPLKSTVEEQLEDYEPVLPAEKANALLAIGKTITYENYLPLWKSILNVTSLKVTPWNLLSIDLHSCLSSKELDTPAYPIFERQTMLVSFYDEIIDSILHIIDRLDLSVEKVKSEVRDRHRCSSVKEDESSLERE